MWRSPGPLVVEFDSVRSRGVLQMASTSTSDVKSAAYRLIENLPEVATWDDVMDRVYVRQAIDAGQRDAAEGRVVDVAEARRHFGLSE